MIDGRDLLYLTHQRHALRGLREAAETIPITFHSLHSFASDGMEIERNLFDVIFFSRMQNTNSLRNVNWILFRARRL